MRSPLPGAEYPISPPEAQVPCFLLRGQYPCPDSPLTTLRAKTPWAQSSAAPSNSEAMRIIAARFLQQVSSRGTARSSRSTATAGGFNQQLPCSPAGSYSLLPSAGARIPASIAFSEGPAARLPGAALGWLACWTPWRVSGSWGQC